MSQRSISRSERRMEKKQAIILLFLVLAVSLVSFSLGVMVGRGGVDKSIAKAEPQAASQRHTLPAPEPQNPALENTSGQMSVAPQTEAAAGAVATPDKPADALTFYETLPRGDLPMGSGINLPPATTDQAVEGSSTVKDIPGHTQPSGSRTVKKTVTASVPAEASHAISATGRYVVQLASFKDTGAAAAFKQKLDAKGYSLFVEQADLGSKGVWYRVYAGPYGDRAAAEQIALRLHQQEKISPLVRKH
jgi:DedD protein